MEILPDLSAFTKMGIATILMLQFAIGLNQNVQESTTVLHIDSYYFGEWSKFGKNGQISGFQYFLTII